MELQARELRIGNYYQENGTTYTTEYYDIANLVRCERNNVVSDMQPIPLTEDWLVKFGFKIHFAVVTKGEIELQKQPYGYSLSSTIEEEDFEAQAIIGNVFSHVHQLQNLIFALTGEELTIKE